MFFDKTFGSQADDPDSKKRITYTIRQGDTDLFSIDPKTGVIKTLRGLDYERDNQYILIVGTEENLTDLPGSTVRVIINVQVRFPPTVIFSKSKCNNHVTRKIGKIIKSLLFSKPVGFFYFCLELFLIECNLILFFQNEI